MCAENVELKDSLHALVLVLVDKTTHLLPLTQTQWARSRAKTSGPTLLRRVKRVPSVGVEGAILIVAKR